MLAWAPSLHTHVSNGHWYDPPGPEPRVGVMLHYDASGTDEGAIGWFRHPDCRVSYHILVLDSGDYVRIAPDRAGPWAGGHCLSSDPSRLPYSRANWAFYHIAAATNEKTDVTPLQTLGVAWWVRQWFARENWPLTDTWRVVGHNTEAVYGPTHPKAGQRGRKTDPVGGDPKNPILSVEDVRQLLPLTRLPNPE